MTEGPTMSKIVAAYLEWKHEHLSETNLPFAAYKAGWETASERDVIAEIKAELEALHKLSAEIGQEQHTENKVLRVILAQRDDFLVKEGLWQKFVDQLPKEGKYENQGNADQGAGPKAG